MKAILIARVSTEEQREAGNSLPAQVTRLERYCQNKGFDILQTCSFDESAYTNDRSAFDRIIDLILEQKEKIAICFHNPYPSSLLPFRCQRVLPQYFSLLQIKHT